MPTVTFQQMLDRLSKHKGSLIATIVTRTRPKMLKSLAGENNPFAMGVERIAVRPVILGVVYESSVNRQREREDITDDFVAVGLWRSKEYPEGAGERDSAYTFRHKGSGKRYFAVQPRTTTEGEIVIHADRYIDVTTGKIVDAESVEKWFPKQSESNNQGTNRKVFWRTIEIEHVEQIRVFGEVFDIIR